DSRSPSLQGDKVWLQLWGDIILEHLQWNARTTQSMDDRVLVDDPTAGGWRSGGAAVDLHRSTSQTAAHELSRGACSSAGTSFQAAFEGSDCEACGRARRWSVAASYGDPRQNRCDPHGRSSGKRHDGRVRSVSRHAEWGSEQRDRHHRQEYSTCYAQNSGAEGAGLLGSCARFAGPPSDPAISAAGSPGAHSGNGGVTGGDWEGRNRAKPARLNRPSYADRSGRGCCQAVAI